VIAVAHVLDLQALDYVIVMDDCDSSLSLIMCCQSSVSWFACCP
jgi:hypothetical protein